MADDPRIAAITERVLGAAKYRSLDPALVRRLVTEVATGTPRDGDAVKTVKRRLHQAFGAFVVGRPAAAVRQARAQVEADPSRLRDAFGTAMRSHASSAERLPHLERFGALVGDWCGEPASVADLGCGLAPLAIPWLPLAPDATYWCCDVDVELVAALRELDAVLPVRLAADTCDLVAEPVTRTADLGLCLKIVTTLEAQRPGHAARVLAALRCAHVIVSLPCGSLGGGRRYTTDPVAQVEAPARAAGYRVDGHEALGPEHYVHLVPRTGD